MAVIEFEHVSKSYQLGAHRTSLRNALGQIPRKLFSNRERSSQNDELFWALRDVSFEVEHGEVLGIIGHNGAGKSTTLKLLSKVTFPTSGSLATHGRLAALIELGAGFHPDLSGRENVFLNGSILGLTRREIQRQFDSIVDFAGLERFIDTPVKRYSSGMYVRLAFAVAAHVNAEVLLVDEVLSVGDETFQRKCFDRLTEIRRSGATIVFVSHNLWAVSNFCTRAILLRNGKVECDGRPDIVIDQYRVQERELVAQQAALLKTGSPAQSGRAHFLSVELLSTDGKPQIEFRSDEQMIVRCHYQADFEIEKPMFVLRINRATGLICTALVSPKSWKERLIGNGVFEVCIGPLMLAADIYYVQILFSERANPIVHSLSSSVFFRIGGGIHGDEAGVYYPEASWTL